MRRFFDGTAGASNVRLSLGDLPNGTIAGNGDESDFLLGGVDNEIAA